QKPGAMVLLGADGMIHGAISGGGLEPELEHRAREVQQEGRAALIEFDTRSDEDVLFGSGTGCRGRISLVLVPQGAGAPLTRALTRLTDTGGHLDLAITANGPRVGSGGAPLGAKSWAWGPDGHIAPYGETGSAVSLRLAAPP